MEIMLTTSEYRNFNTPYLELHEKSLEVRLDYTFKSRNIMSVAEQIVVLE